LNVNFINLIIDTTNILSSKNNGIKLMQFNPEIDEELIDDLEHDNYNFNKDINLLDICNEIIKKNNMNLTEKHIMNRIKGFLYSIVLTTVKTNKFIYSLKSKDNIDIDLTIFALCLLTINRANIENIENTILLNYSNSHKDLDTVKEKLNEIFPETNNNYNIGIRYNKEMLKNEYLRDNSKNFNFLILGPEFLVSESLPALGMVYKITEINGLPCIKFSEEKSKQTIPGFKKIFRLYNANDEIIGDYMSYESEKIEEIFSPLEA
jgi:hypothetical protein